MDLCLVFVCIGNTKCLCIYWGYVRISYYNHFYTDKLLTVWRRVNITNANRFKIKYLCICQRRDIWQMPLKRMRKKFKHFTLLDWIGLCFVENCVRLNLNQRLINGFNDSQSFRKILNIFACFSMTIFLENLKIRSKKH